MTSIMLFVFFNFRIDFLRSYFSKPERQTAPVSLPLPETENVSWSKKSIQKPKGKIVMIGRGRMAWVEIGQNTKPTQYHPDISPSVN